jgi:hypothetical protein
MSTFDRWNKLAGLQNEAAEPQQLAESKQQPESSKQMNESDLRGMIAELAKEILSERRATNPNVALIQNALNAISGGYSAIKDDLDQFPMIANDGKFGRDTKVAVQIFQDYAALPDDGVVGPNTLKALANVFGPEFGSNDHEYGIKFLIDQGVVAKQGHGFEGKKSSKQAAPKPAAPGENPLNRVLKNLVKRIKDGGENVDEKSVKSAMVDKMKSDPAFATNVRDLSKVANKDQFTHRLMRKISQPVMVALSTSGSDTMVASADSEEDFDWLEDSGDVGASAATPGDPVKYDDDPASMPTLPGIDPEVFAGGIEMDAGDGSGDRILTIPRRQWQKSGLDTDDLDRIAKAAGVDRVVISK